MQIDTELLLPEQALLTSIPGVPTLMTLCDIEIQK